MRDEFKNAAAAKTRNPWGRRTFDWVLQIPIVLQKGTIVPNSSVVIAVVTVTLMSSTARADYPVVDAVAKKVIEKYQTTSCEQLKQQKAQGQGQPKSEAVQRAVRLLHEDAGARAEFFSKISTPVVTKLFECGMIP